MKKLPLLLGILSITILSSMGLVGLTSSAGVYDPWYDLDSNGKIDIFDVVRLAGTYGTSGAPFGMKAALAYDSGWLDIRALKGQDIVITHNVDIESLGTAWFPRATGKAVEAGPTHRRCLDLSYTTPDGWEQTYGDPLADEFASSGLQTSDGGYVLAGRKNEDMWLAKADSNGELLWETTFGGGDVDAASSVIQTSDGGYLLAGQTCSLDVDGDMWVVKTDANGTYEWENRFGATGEDTACDVVQADDGGYVLAGTTVSFGSSGGRDVWIVKTDSAGNYQWHRTYGGTLDDWAQHLVKTSEGGYALACTTGSIAGKTDDLWLVKTDAAGMYEWGENFGGPYYDNIGDVVQTSDGGYALVGSHQFISSNPVDVWLIKADSVGNHVWNRTYDSGQGSDDWAAALVQTRDGGYAIGGYTSTWGLVETNGWLLKTDSVGNLEWDRVFGGDSYDIVSWLAQTAEEGYVWAGCTVIEMSYQGWLVKTDAFGLTDNYEYGLALVDYTPNTLVLHRGRFDPYWNYLRVELWVVKTP